MSKFPPQGRRVGMSSLSDEKVEEELSKINPNVKVNSIINFVALLLLLHLSKFKVNMS